VKLVSRVVGAAVGGLVVALPVVAPPALAADGYNRCPANSACMFQDVNGNGLVFAINRAHGGRGEDSNFHDNPCVGPQGDCRSSRHSSSNGTWGDQASSVYNRLNQRFCFYKDPGFRGGVIKIQAGQRTNLPGSFNDEISSGRPC
jgi:peptidase inhibitor family I36